MLCRRSVIHFAGASLSCTSPHSPSFFRHDEEILGHDQEHPDRWRHGFATHRAGQSLLDESYFPVAVAFGRSAAVCNTSHSLADQHAAPFALRAWRRKAASPPFGGRNTRLGISRHKCQEFRHDEIFEIGTQTSSAALGHCQSLVVVVIVLLRLLLPIQVW